MTNNQFYFPGVTLLITHYNRSGSLERLLSTFNTLNCKFDEIVVSDDASKSPHIEKLRALQQVYNYRLVTTNKNTGFPGNMNRAQEAVNTPYTLYIQEDFVPLPGCQQHLLDALNIMIERPDFDYIRFWSFYKYPNLKPYAKGFSETIFKNLELSHLKFFMYSDNPHLRHSNFLTKFGRYNDNFDGNVAEYRMSISFMQKKGKGLFYEGYDTLFDHRNSPDEPSTFDRPDWKLKKNIFVRLLRWGYLRYKWLKSHKDLKFLRT